jgi:hypothetical protein
VESNWVHSAQRPPIGLLCQPRVIINDGEIGGMMTRRGKPKYSEKTCPSATLSTTNPTWPDVGSNRGHRGGKPATNRLSYGTAICYVLRLRIEGFWKRANPSKSRHGTFLPHQSTFLYKLCLWEDKVEKKNYNAYTYLDAIIAQVGIDHS